jgi:hypothetical protein
VIAMVKTKAEAQADRTNLAPEQRMNDADGIDPRHQEFYELGRKVEAVLRGGERSKASAALKVATHMKTEGSMLSNPSNQRLERALDFFERFDEADLRRLGLIRTRKGESIPETYLYILAVEDRDHREALLRFLESGRRTRAELLAENRRLRGEQLGPGGQRPRKPESLREAVEQTIMATDDWLKLEAVAWSDDDSWLPNRGEAGDTELLKRLNKARTRVQEVVNSARRLNRRLQNTERQLAQLGEATSI